MTRINIFSAIAIALFLPLTACEHDPSQDLDSGTDPDTPADVDGYGLLSVSTMPDGATVRVNDIMRGVTPVLVEDLTPGSYLVEISLTGYQDYSDTVTVNVDSTTPLDITLEPETPTYDLNGRWSRDGTSDICDVSQSGNEVSGFEPFGSTVLYIDGDSIGTPDDGSGNYFEGSILNSGDKIELTLHYDGSDMSESYTRL